MARPVNQALVATKVRTPGCATMGVAMATVSSSCADRIPNTFLWGRAGKQAGRQPGRHPAGWGCRHASGSAPSWLHRAGCRLYLGSPQQLCAWRWWGCCEGCGVQACLAATMMHAAPVLHCMTCMLPPGPRQKILLWCHCCLQCSAASHCQTGAQSATRRLNETNTSPKAHLNAAHLTKPARKAAWPSYSRAAPRAFSTSTSAWWTDA